MAGVSVPANSEILVWARSIFGYESDEVAGKLDVKPEKVKAWEQGEAMPTLRQLEQLSDLYKQPLVTFFQDKPPEEPKWPNDYRTFHHNNHQPLSPKTKTAIWEAQWRRSVAADLRREIGIEFKVNLADLKLGRDPEKAASMLRERIGPDVKTQAEWAKEPYQLFRRWRGVIEGMGVLVFRLDFPKEDARGFALPDSAAPVIAVSAKDYKSAALFTLFHELAHLLMHESSACNDLEFRDAPHTDVERVEALSNRFAGAFLVPQDALLAHKSVRAGKSSQWSDEQLRELAGFFGVSREVALRRLVILGKTDIPFYRKWKNRQNENWQDYAPKKRGFAVPHGYARKVISRQGEAYVSTVIDAYARRIINLSETSEYLGVKTKNIGDIEYVLGSGVSD